jgi:hypothetical protein
MTAQSAAERFADQLPNLDWSASSPARPSRDLNRHRREPSDEDQRKAEDNRIEKRREHPHEDEDHPHTYERNRETTCPSHPSIPPLIPTGPATRRVAPNQPRDWPCRLSRTPRQGAGKTRELRGPEVITSRSSIADGGANGWPSLDDIRRVAWLCPECFCFRSDGPVEAPWVGNAF